MRLLLTHKCFEKLFTWIWGNAMGPRNKEKGNKKGNKNYLGGHGCIGKLLELP